MKRRWSIITIALSVAAIYLSQATLIYLFKWYEYRFSNFFIAHTKYQPPLYYMIKILLKYIVTSAAIRRKCFIVLINQQIIHWWLIKAGRNVLLLENNCDHYSCHNYDTHKHNFKIDVKKEFLIITQLSINDFQGHYYIL